MILPDINLLVYAYNSKAPGHQQAKEWWEDCLSEDRPVGLPWAVILGYVRLMTSRSVLVDPLSAEEAIRHVRSWLERPQVQVLQPGPRHLDLLDGLMREAPASGKLTTDSHLAALAIEHQADLHSNDSDFSRFPGLRWTNPLQQSA
jgi:toxin-antitoxin system PIN domain toxin